MFRFRHKTVYRLHNQLYAGGKRRLTEGILNQMHSPLAWALWYQDDGSLIKHRVTNQTTGMRHINNRTLRLNFNRYTSEELELVANWMARRLGVTARLERADKYFRLAMGMQQASKFFDYIRPFVVPSMQYKLDPEYETVRVPEAMSSPLKIQSDPGSDVGSPAETSGPSVDANGEQQP